MRTNESNASGADANRRVIVLGTGGTIAGTGGKGNSNIAYTAATVTVGELLSGIDAPVEFELQAQQVAQIAARQSR
jgi:L-asparaginase